MTASPAPASASLRPTTNTPVVGAPLKPVFDWVLVVASLAVVAVFVRAMLFTPIFTLAVSALYPGVSYH